MEGTTTQAAVESSSYGALVKVIRKRERWGPGAISDHMNINKSHFYRVEAGERSPFAVAGTLKLARFIGASAVETETLVRESIRAHGGAKIELVDAQDRTLNRLTQQVLEWLGIEVVKT